MFLYFLQSVALSSAAQHDGNGSANLVRFNATKTQACLFSAERSPFDLASPFRDVPVSIADHLELLGMNLTLDLNFGHYIESLATTAAK